MNVYFFLVLAQPYPVKWQIKSGCLENDTVISEYMLLPPSHALSCAAKQDLWDIGTVYGWGQCNGTKVQIGSGETPQECKDSIRVKGGFHREIIFTDPLKAGDCKCTANGKIFNAFHCLDKRDNQPTLLQSGSNTEPQEHSTDDTYFPFWIVFVILFFVILVIFIPSM